MQLAGWCVVVWLGVLAAAGRRTQDKLSRSFGCVSSWFLHPAGISMLSTCFITSWFQQPAGTSLDIATRFQCLAESCVLSFDLVAEKPVVEKVVKAAVKRRPAPAAEPVAKKKRTTVGRAAPTLKYLSIVPVEVTDKEKRDVEVIDSEDTEPLSKVLKLTATSMFDEESLPIDEILKQIPEDMMVPSISAEEPTMIKFGRGIAFKEVDWYKATLPSIDSAANGKEPLVEEIKGNPAKEIFALIRQMYIFLYRFKTRS
ncbi:putative rhamnogalacturonate lyase B [Dorcoceras hygrometricum]|uniref:Putative rhamnogalacturonate lyase B n=1 Tax=Dorcoceras hygrometricum TaxID=472368 RepID=A0A2Z7AEY1_9LAMI|nr:putative rhamnogalacturonate lyase B [Dorcoceras hygrometricum]